MTHERLVNLKETCALGSWAVSPPSACPGGSLWAADSLSVYV